MAKKLTKRPNRLLDKVIVTAKHRARKDISQWRMALTQAENPENPKRFYLLNIYDEITLDAHLSGQMQKRRQALVSRQYNLVDSKGKISDKTQLLQKPWFSYLLGQLVDTIFFGHSLIQIEQIENGEITDIRLIDRRHIVPERKLFLKSPLDDKGIDYTQPKYEKWLIEINYQSPEYLGLLNKAVPHVLYKRFAQAAWSEFTEIFGMPLRFAKTNTKDAESLNRMEQMLYQMGTAGYGVIDKDEELIFIESAKSNGEIYQGLINLCNNEVSKLINGAVIGEASKDGSRAKEQVGLQIGQEIASADLEFAENYINHYLLPKLIKLGYPLAGLQFVFEKERDINKLWNITQGILNYYEVDPQFIKETFGIPVTGIKQQSPTLKAKPDDFFD